MDKKKLFWRRFLTVQGASRVLLKSNSPYLVLFLKQLDNELCSDPHESIRTLAFSYLIPILILSLYPHCGRPIYFLHWGFKTKDFVVFTCFKTPPPIWSENTSSCLQQPELGSADILGVISTFSAYSCFRAYASHTELSLKSTVPYVMTAHHGYRKQQHTVPLEEENSCFSPAKLRPFVLVLRVVCRWRWVWNNGGMVLSGANRVIGRKNFPITTRFTGGTRWRSWLRHCATSLAVAGSIPGGVFGSFVWHNPSGRTMTLTLA